MPISAQASGSVISVTPRNGAGVPSAAALARGQPRPAGGQVVNPVANGSQWYNKNKTNLLKSALSHATATSEKVPAPANNNGDSAQLASQFGQLNMFGPWNPGQPGQKVLDPSMGPTPSMVTTNWRAHTTVGSQASNRSFRKAVNSTVCKLSGFTRRDYRLGDVIALPFHTPNSNPNVDPSDRRLTNTVEGPAYSKRRMVVVLWIYQQDMFCVPLYTFEHKGLKNKPNFLKQEYVSMMNLGDAQFENQGMYPPVIIKCRKWSIDPDTTVHITGGVRIACNEDISRVGRLTQESYCYLVGLWRTLSNEAQKERW